MKSLVPWFYLVAAAGSQAVYAVNGLDAYRQGNYPLAAQTLISNSGDPIADYYLGRMRLYGYGQLKNNALALNHFTLAAEKGVLAAQQLLARYNLLEEKNPQKALYWFKKAAAAGDVQAQMYCAAAYMFGLGTKKNPDLARQYYVDAAKSGNAIAQSTLGSYFLESRNMQNKKLGVIWLSKAAAQGDVEAQAKLGQMYATGTVVGRNNEKSVELLAKAAAQNSIPAMVSLGELAIKSNQLEVGRDWLAKAASAHDPRAELLLSRLYVDPKSKFFDLKTGLMWTLQAAQNGSTEAQNALALMYKEGKGIEANAELAAQWQQKAKEKDKDKNKAKQTELSAETQAARWLTNGKTNNFVSDSYALGGIYSAWQNPLALKENNYNAAPQMETVSRAELYQPKFVMTQPTEIAINDYFDLIAPSLNAKHAENWTFPRYPLDKQVEALQRNESLVLQHQSKFSMIDEGAPSHKGGKQTANYVDEKTAGWVRQANYQAVLNQLYGQAILGDSAAQFELGQLYQYGIIVGKNLHQAAIYYQLAAAQQDVRAEYNLGIMYLENTTNPDYQQGINWLTDAAFKGNVYAQYVLANIYEKGFIDSTANIAIQPDRQQSLAMYYLASSNGYGPAEYRLANYLVKQRQAGLSIIAKQNRINLIRRLYQGAVNQGVAEASLPLAFYNAMDSNPDKQKEALAVAKKEAKAGNSEAALLLGMLFERGIATAVKPAEALYWYQQAAMNPANAFILGTYYSEGNGLTKDVEKGRALLQQAADAGFSYANLNLAVLKEQRGEDFLPELTQARELGNNIAGILLADYYLAQANDPEKMQQARDIYQYLAEKGDKEGQLKLAYLYDTGLGGKLDREEAAKWYTAAAEQGQPIAQYLLGQLYQLGHIGKQPDYTEAKKWYAAAQSVYSKAAVALGFIYDTVEDNYLKAIESYDLAVKKNDVVGEFDLALIYDKGKGVPVDYAKAKALYTKAADQGYARAMAQLAGLYFNGQGTARNEQQAIQLYKKAAVLGDSDALYQLGLLSETGVAIKLDFPSAVNYYDQAAAKGNEKAKLALARMYKYGLGVQQDSQEATRLYTELAAKNNAYAQYQLALDQFNRTGEHKSDEGKRLLQQASANGSQNARKMLQWLDAQQQDKVSFIEPIAMAQAPALAEQPANLMYFAALSEWNSGDEDVSRRILNRLVRQFPQYVPAKRAFDQLNQSKSPLSLVFNEAKRE